MNQNINTSRYGDGDIPEIDQNGSAREIDTERYRNGAQVEPLPESTRERRDGPGGD